MLKNTKKVFSLILAIAVVAMSMFTGVVVSAANDTADTTAHGVVDLLEFGDYLTEAGSTSKYYDSVLADNGETGADWDNAIIIDSAEELVYLCKASGVDTEGKYYKVADGIAGFNLASNNLDVNGTFASPSKVEGKTNFDVVKGNGKNHSGGGNDQGFRGYFDGNGATVYGAWTNHESVSPYAGLFSATVGTVTIKNIHVKMAHFTATTAVGGIVGYHSSTDMATLTIENCSVTDSYFEVNSSGWNKGVGAILGCGNSAPAKREANDDVDYNGDGDKVDNIYINDPYIIKNCYVNLDADNFVTVGGFAPGSVAGQQVCRGGVIGVCGSNAAMVSDCVVIGITPYATSISNDNNSVQHSGLESHFQNVYTTADVAVADVAIGGTVGLRQFTGRVFPTADANLKGAAAANLNLDWSIWMLDDEGYPEPANAHKSVAVVDNEDGTHAATCACGFGGIDADHAFVDGTCACGALLNCATRKTIYWDGTVASGIATGTGAKEDPYVIKAASELAWLIQQKADVTTDKYYEIDPAIGAIVLQPKDKAEAIMALGSSAEVKSYFDNETGLVEWVEVGWEQSSFCGDFDGNGVTIYGLYSISANNAGLFSTVDAGAAFHNIALKNSYLTSTANNYQVAGIAAVTSSSSYGRKTDGAVWFDGCVVANNYMYNPSTSHDRSGVIMGAAGDVVIIDNCLVYGNDATYGEAAVVMPINSAAKNSVSALVDVIAPDGVVLEDDGTDGNPLYYNSVRNSIIFGAKPYDLAQQKGSRFNDPKCYTGVLTDADVATDTFAGTEVTLGATEEQIKTVTLEDLADLELANAFIKTDSYPELRAFHDEVFGEGVSVGKEGHAASCSCGLPDSNVQAHDFVSDVQPAEWDSTYCSVCGYVCEHEDGEEVEYEGDCVTQPGYSFDCPTCGYHEGERDDAFGHSFEVHEAEKGADCLTAGTKAYKYCSACEKNYEADATEFEPFENAITDLTGEYGDHEVLVEADEIVYGKDGKNHWTICATCEKPIETTEHTLAVEANGAEGHSASCEICGYEEENVPHTFGDDNICDVEGCEWACTDHHFVDGEVKTPGDCTTDKVTEQICEICGIAGEDKVETAPGHTPADAKQENVVPGDCTTDTTFDLVVRCSVCNEVLSSTPDTIPAPDHDYAEATCKAPETCKVCGATRGEKKAHTYTTTTTKATTSKNGSIVKKCTACGYVASTTTIKYAKTFTLSATSYTYSGSNKTPTVTVKDSAGTKLKKNVDYTLSVASSRKNVGTYKVTVKMIGNYTGTKTLTFKINPAKLGSCKLSATTYTYSGKNKTPSVTVKNAAGTKLKKNTDYTISVASTRKNVGTYKVTIKGKGNYTGTKTLTFKINPAKTSVSKLTAGKKSITVNIAKKSTQVTGYQVQYSTSKSFSKTTTKTISSYKTTKYTLKSLSAKKTYYVRVRTYKTVNGTKYYSGWSTAKSVKTK